MRQSDAWTARGEGPGGCTHLNFQVSSLLNPTNCSFNCGVPTDVLFITFWFWCSLNLLFSVYRMTKYKICTTINKAPQIYDQFLTSVHLIQHNPSF